MSEPNATEAVIGLDAEGRYTDANPAALDLLGVSLEELLASSPDRFTIQESDPSEAAALRTEWEAGGSRPMVGTAGLRRADGTTIRVAYAIETVETGLRARLRPIEGRPEAPSSVYTVGDVLREWRVAERELSRLVPGSPEWARTSDEVDLLRGKYQALFRSIEPQTRGG